MSHLGIALRRIAEKNHQRGADLARATNRTTAHLSRLLSGVQKYVSDADLLAILDHISQDNRERAEIIAARCRDVCLGPGADLVEVTLKERKGRAAVRREKGGFGFGEVRLSQESERAFAWLRSQCPLNPDLEKHLVGYARLTGMPPVKPAAK